MSQHPVMFCSWRKKPSAPCSCAYQLQGEIPDVFNQLRHLGNGTLILRQQGLSVAKTTPFGLSIASGKGTWQTLHDRISGLETDLSCPQNLYLMTDISDRRPLLAMGEPGRAIDLSIRLDGYTWECSAITGLLHRFDAVPLACHESRRLGAGAWLDEWEQCGKPDSDSGLIRVASEALHNCRALEVRIKSRTHANIMKFVPSFIDSEGGVLRVADRNCRHVVYADVEASEFRLECLADGQVRISRDSTTPHLAA